MKRTVFTVSDFVSWMEAGELELSPSFQRRSTWRPAAKSLFIDTIVRGLPVPIIFLREKTNVETLRTVREVVDGQQRLRTIISFLNPYLLKDLDPKTDKFLVRKTHNKDIANLPFSNFDNDLKARILSYQFSVDVLPRDTDDAEVLKIFSRMNATGTSLTAQELRNAEWHGEFHKAVYQSALEQLDRWRKWAVFTENNIARMEEAELVSELFMFMLSGITAKTKTSIDNAYKKYDEEFPFAHECAKRLSLIFDELDDLIGDDFRHTEFGRKALFYPMFTAAHSLIYGNSDATKKIKSKPLHNSARRALHRASELITTKSASPKVLEAAARRTTHKASRDLLHNFILGELTNADT